MLWIIVLLQLIEWSNQAISHELSASYLVWMPMRKTEGSHAPDFEQFNKKTIYVYQNRMQIVSSLTSTPQYSRLFSFSHTILECGSHQNKICLAQEYLDYHNDFTYHQSLLEYQENNKLEIGNQCILVPIIDGDSNADKSRSVIYICETDGSKIREFFIFKDKLSKFIDRFHILLMYDHFSSSNGVNHKKGFLKVNDAKNNFQTVEARLFPNLFRVYFPNTNLHKVLMQIYITSINRERMTMPVMEAINKKYIKNNWVDNYQPKQLSPCCFVLFEDNDSTKKMDEKFFCIDYPDPKDFDYNDCGNKVNSWVRFINGQIQRRLIIDKYYLLKELKAEFSCKKEKKSELFVERIRGLALYHDKICSVIRKSDENWEQKQCDIDKSNDISQEIDKIAFQDSLIKVSLETCVKKGHVEIGIPGFVFS